MATHHCFESSSANSRKRCCCLGVSFTGFTTLQEHQRQLDREPCQRALTYCTQCTTPQAAANTGPHTVSTADHCAQPCNTAYHQVQLSMPQIISRLHHQDYHSHASPSTPACLPYGHHLGASVPGAWVHHSLAAHLQHLPTQRQRRHYEFRLAVNCGDSHRPAYVQTHTSSFN